MRTAAIIVMCFVCAWSVCDAQERAAADTVLRLTPGTGQNNGQGPAFFPRNVLGYPTASLADTVPVTDPREVCSIGLDGEIIVGFRDRVVVDGPGDDLTIYENAFRYNDSLIYAEPAIVSVSRDGIAWTSFPWDSLTLEGCAGVTPAVGDGFDLATIGVDSIRWIKLTDVTRVILDNAEHPFYDPTLTGFDLDAVVSDHTVRVANATQVTLIPRSTTIDISVASASAELRITDVRGVTLHTEVLARGVYQRSLDKLVQTCLMVMLSSEGATTSVKVLQ
jgi:hypothetical protein